MTEPDHQKTVIREAAADVDDEIVIALIMEYLQAAIRRVAEDLPGSGMLDGLVSSTDEKKIRKGLKGFRRPHGRILLVEQGGNPVGIGALRTIGRDVGEIKRLYLRPGARRQGLGRAVGKRLLEEAQSMGLCTVRLDTFRGFDEARELVGSGGFRERGPYEGTEIPEDLWEHWTFYERELPSHRGTP
ncbi:GNAT family N-acetyltransferase [Streptomyces coeruleorubidus]|uniref:GNAT family N-acetyltransferase n=1 Tax=Streptomyces coeruleorubidus TaxID=116188 RepID=A0ABZ0K9B4_STRC4|nr:GNAT family N-acetyltransferase [Streptomyces coeruleorubidus]WOT34235.1 GNAT family N-acetyltransferase [Streptomyces coeruleorubidus]WOT34262.1 GNAT family N-acetyltransferase [Streptomyces coeruleorubidus]WOT34289.1 GNAT family N-acetyltransferase [Streptomyces coeruleorubidus]